MSELASSNHSVLHVEQLTVRYGDTVVVESIDMQADGGTAVLFGPSGCGKTTILKAILNTQEPGMQVSGTILVDGESVKPGAGDVGMVFQGPVLPEWLTLFDLCRMGCRIRTVSPSTQRDRILAMLDRFGISELAHRYPSTFSGGQRQRAAVAVSLLNEPRVLLLDEPSTFLDGVSRIAIWEFLETELRALGIPVVVVTHDPEEAAILADTVYRLDANGRLAERLNVGGSHPRSADSLRDDEQWSICSQLRAHSPRH